MERSKILCLRKFTLWYSLFPFELDSVVLRLKSVVSQLYNLGLFLDVPEGILDALKADFPFDSSRRRRELVREWMNSSLDPPCWWHLVQALHDAERGQLAQEIADEFGKLV